MYHIIDNVHLYILYVFYSPGTVNAFVFGVDRETFERLTWTSIKVK